MTFSVLIAVILGKKIGLKERLLIQQSSNSIETQGVVRLSLSIVLISFIFETLGALLLTVRWANDLGVAKALYYGIFHSISAFNNAGFSLWSDSLSRYVGDPLVNIVISFLFIIGGIGFIVILDLYRKRSWKALSFHTKIVLITSGVLCFAGFLVIFVFELFNTRTFGTLTWGKESGVDISRSGYRTAGFNSIDIGAMLPASQFFMIFLMFIGASSGSTGGGSRRPPLRYSY